MFLKNSYKMTCGCFYMLCGFKLIDIFFRLWGIFNCIVFFEFNRNRYVNDFLLNKCYFFWCDILFIF